MSDLTLEQLEELERLEREATPGPWRSMRDGNQYINTSYSPAAKCVGASRLEGVVRPWNPHALLAFGFKPEEYETARFLDADADVIAAARNALPALLAAARELTELKSALEFLAGHGDLFDLWQEEDGVHAETPHGLHGVTAPTAAAALLHHTRRRGWTPPGEQKGEEVTNG